MDLLTGGIDSLGMLVFWIAAEKELGLDFTRKVRSVREVISVCEQLVAARLDNR
jgi:acyl carrier protein